VVCPTGTQVFPLPPVGGWPVQVGRRDVSTKNAPRLEPEGLDELGDQTLSTSKFITVPVDSVIIQDRFRKQISEVADLAKSIADVGLINPITVNEDMHLIAGERRLRAFEHLGLAEIPVHIVADLLSATELVRAERDENTQRLPMLQSELTALGMALELMEKPAALERQIDAGRTFGRGSDSSGSRDPNLSTKQELRPRDIAAEAIGMGEATYRRMKTLTNDSTNENLPAEIRAEATASIERIDQGGKVRTEYDRIKELKAGSAALLQKTGTTDWVQIEMLASGGARSHNVAERFGLTRGYLVDAARTKGITFHADKIVSQKRIDPLAVLENIVAGLEATHSSLEVIDFESVTREQADEWLERLIEPLRGIRKMQNNLKEIN
jgi:ParB-like chromosome segregation protein Spo0J